MPLFGKRKEVPVAPQPAGFGHRTPEQIAEALGAAHLARKDRALFLDRVRSKEVTLQDILEGDYWGDPIAREIHVRTLLRALPGARLSQVNRLIDKMGIIEGRRVKGLGVHQRNALLEWRSQNMPAEGEE
jgi:hypothetical protein